MTIDEVEILDILPYENNPRINYAAIEMLVESIRAFGFQIPIILDKDNVIVAGHTRVEAAKILGMDKIPAIYARDLSPEQVKAFRIMDNRTAEQSTWDYKKLIAEFDALDSLNWEMDTTGFDLLDIESIRCDLESKPANKPNIASREGENTPRELDDTDTPPFEETDEKPEPRNTMVIQYNIVFNTEDEQKIWFDYIRSLKAKYPDLATISERLVADIVDKTIDGLS